MIIGKEKILFSSTLIDSALKIKLTKDRFTKGKHTNFIYVCNAHTQGRNSVMSNSNGWLEVGAFMYIYHLNKEQ